MNEKACPICNISAIYEIEVIEQDDGSALQEIFQCSRCGKFLITSQAEHFFNTNKEEYSPRTITNISSWLKENEIFRINYHNINGLIKTASLPIQERVHKLLLYIEKKTTYIGEVLKFDPADQQLLSLTWSINSEELRELFNFLIESGYLINQYPTLTSAIAVKIAIPGFNYITKIKQASVNSTQAFVAMSFKEELVPLYNSYISKAIEMAGYRPLRIDQKEHINKIDDEIVAEIRKSKFIVADLTNRSNGVYYEAGLAQGLNIPVFFTHKKEETLDLHFDIQQYNCLLWDEDNLDQFKGKLAYRIEATLGRGPLIQGD